MPLYTKIWKKASILISWYEVTLRKKINHILDNCCFTDEPNHCWQIVYLNFALLIICQKSCLIELIDLIRQRRLHLWKYQMRELHACLRTCEVFTSYKEQKKTFDCRPMFFSSSRLDILLSQMSWIFFNCFIALKIILFQPKT